MLYATKKINLSLAGVRSRCELRADQKSEFQCLHAGTVTQYLRIKKAYLDGQQMLFTVTILHCVGLYNTFD